MSRCNCSQRYEFSIVFRCQCQGVTVARDMSSVVFRCQCLGVTVARYTRVFSGIEALAVPRCNCSQRCQSSVMFRCQSQCVTAARDIRAQ